MESSTIITKKFLSIEDQIELLEKRGLKFRNRKRAVLRLSQYNYFDVINGFESIFLYSNNPKTYKDIYFEDFYDSYCFDIKLKTKTLECIFDIECRLRTSIAYHFASKYCNNESDTLNYLDSSFYKAPNPADTYLKGKFDNFDLFRKAKCDGSGRVIKKSFLEEIKENKKYVAKYDKPPCWVTIKTLTLGSLYFLFIFLPDDVKEKVLNDFGFTIKDADAFYQSLFILKEMRNQCAHLELITRFKLKPDKNMNYFNDAKNVFGLSRKSLCYLDVLKILKRYGKVHTIKTTIFGLYLRLFLKGRKKIAVKLLSKMGRKSIIVWIKV